MCEYIENLKKGLDYEKRKILLVSALLLSSIAITNKNSEAASISGYHSGSFDRSRERYASGDNGNAQLTYGFNTWAFNEDYAKARHNAKSHYAAIKNGNGWHTGAGKSAGSTSRVDVIHSGTSISYYNYY